jgi:hypothetical protein
MADDAKGLAIAFEEAQISYNEGGIPVGLRLHCVLVREESIY